MPKAEEVAQIEAAAASFRQAQGAPPRPAGGAGAAGALLATPQDPDQTLPLSRPPASQTARYSSCAQHFPCCRLSSTLLYHVRQ